MKKTILFLFAFLVASNANQVYAQSSTSKNYESWSCGAMQELQANVASDPSVQSKFNQLCAVINAQVNSTTSANSAPTSPYTIPVVFHVISDATYPTPIPTYTQILWQLATLNAAFSNSLNTLNNTPTGPHAVNTQITFCMAKQVQTSTTPTAWPTSNYGVINYTTTNTALTSNIVSGNLTSLQTLVALTNYTLNFPPDKYLNIWCVPNITNLSTGYSVYDQPSIIGEGTFPWMSWPVDGVIIRNDAIGSNVYSAFNMFSGTDKGTILAHEVGHYLGLLHTFETITNYSLSTIGGAVGCYGTTSVTAYSDGDLVYDTPPTKINSNVAPGPINSCNENYAPYGVNPNENDQLENFMCYSDDDYLNSFTLGQANVMWATLTGTSTNRTNLWTSTNLTATGVNLSPSCGPELVTAAFNYHSLNAQTTCTSMAVQFNVPYLPPYLANVTYSWTFGDGGTSTLANPVHTYTLPPLAYTAQLVVTSGTTSVTHTAVINVNNGLPTIVGHTGSSFPVCRGSEQTIFIKFPPFATSAVVTDGINYYTVNNNCTHSCTAPNGVYTYPFTFTISGSSNYSLIPANCSTISTGVASFTVIDCCSNLVNNGDFESGNTGYYSNYILNTVNTGTGYVAINYPALTDYTAMVNNVGNTGKFLILDSYGYTTFGTGYSPGSQSLIIGQTITGLKPNTNYYFSIKINQSADSVSMFGPNKFKIRLTSASTGTILNKNFVPSTTPPSTCAITQTITSSPLQIRNFTVATPSTITNSTTFSLELYELDNFGANGFDYAIDNLILCEMNPPLTISPLTASICPGGTVQLSTTNNCVNISNYSLSWQPYTSLSCSSCANPVASPSVTTVYTLVAVPPITNPPSQNIILTTQIFVPTPILSLVSPTPCASGVFTINATGVPTASWLPSNTVSTNIVVTPSAPTVYTASYTYSNCTGTNTLLVAPPSAATINASNSYICTNLVLGSTLTALAPYSTNPTNVFWSPGNYTGNPFAINPSSTTTYSVIMQNQNSCSYGTLAVTVASNCCTQTITTITAPTLTASTNFAASVLFGGNLTILPNQSMTLTAAEYFFAPDVKIYVSNNASLSILGTHLYACGTEMWGGIVVKDGGKVYGNLTINPDHHNLIEDAKIGINVESQSTSTLTNILELHNTIFNKNYIDVSIGAYQRTLTTYPFTIDNCVFTCRNLPFSSVQWPTVDANNTVASNMAQLRTVFNATTGLQSPYLGQTGFTVTPLKNPYSGQNSSTAIQLTNVGATTYTNNFYNGAVFYGVQIGDASLASNFNLFDSHRYGIYATNSNLKSYNNVYQNSTGTGLNGDGSGIYSQVIGSTSLDPLFNNLVDLNPGSNTNLSLTNRFWNCRIGVNLFNTYRFNSYWASYRSTQSSTAGISNPSLQGYMGIRASTNRFAKYDIIHVNFNNLNNAVSISLNAGPYATSTNTQNGTYAGDLLITDCYFGANITNTATLGNNYLNKAVDISGATGPTWNFVGGTGVYFANSYVDRAFNGVSFSGLKSVNCQVGANSINLIDENIASLNQRAVSITNCTLTTAINNSLTGQNTTNTRMSLFYGNTNDAPKVVCNIANTAYEGFVFDNSNPFATWKGNSMQNHERGMALKLNGIISQQGSNGNPTDNRWAGSWAGSNYGTYTDQFSDAANSRLFVKSALTPTNNFGVINNQSYNQSGNYTITTGAYACTSSGGINVGYPNKDLATLVSSKYAVAEWANLSMAMFRFIQNNDSLRINTPEFNDMYDSLSGTNIDLLTQVESNLYAGNITTAMNTNASISPANDIEANYKSFYNLYAHYVSGSFNSTDSSNLYSLAQLCPGINGACVFQARALYASIYEGAGDYNDECTVAGARKMNTTGNSANKNSYANSIIDPHKIWTVDLFPNPANNKITVVSKEESEQLIIEIRDLNNKVLFSKTVLTTDFIANLDLTLINGIYFINISNTKGESTFKKLLIAK